MLQLVRIMDELPEALAAVRAAAHAEGYRHIERLYADWASGTERFDKPGEALFMAVLEGDAAGVGGITREPTDPTGDVLRARRLYVAPPHRGAGIARAIVGALVQEGFANAGRVTVHAGPEADAFWDAMGFARIDHPQLSHELRHSGSAAR